MILACGCGGLLEAAMVVAAGGMTLLTAIWFKVRGFFVKKPTSRS